MYFWCQTFVLLKEWLTHKWNVYLPSCCSRHTYVIVNDVLAALFLYSESEQGQGCPASKIITLYKGVMWSIWLYILLYKLFFTFTVVLKFFLHIWHIKVRCVRFGIRWFQWLTVVMQKSYGLISGLSFVDCFVVPM